MTAAPLILLGLLAGAWAVTAIRDRLRERRGGMRRRMARKDWAELDALLRKAASQEQQMRQAYRDVLDMLPDQAAEYEAGEGSEDE